MKKNRKLAHILGERQDMTKERLDLVNDLSIENEHIRRYTAVRRFCYGSVLDCACGTGYGSYIASFSDYVKSVTGIDADSEALSVANEEFKKDKITFKKSKAE